MFAGIGLVRSGLNCPITSHESLSLLTNIGNTDLVLQHVLLLLRFSVSTIDTLAVRYIVQGVPNYYSFISAPIIPKEISK